MKLKTIEAASLLAFFTLLIFSLLSFENDCKDIREDCFRLHIIANSDTEKDQRLKLHVRDSILRDTAKLFSKAKDKNEAIELCKKEEKAIRKYAEDAINKMGYDYDVRIETAKTFFPTRTYEKYTLPAGKYDALKIIIGEGKGKNWWCVMFPSLCLPTFIKRDKLSDVLNEDEIRLIEKNPKYEIRFWIVEKIQKLKNNKNDTQS